MSEQRRLRQVNRRGFPPDRRDGDRRLGRDHWRPGARRGSSAASKTTLPTPPAGQDRRRRHDPQPGDLAEPRASTASSGSPTPTASATSTPPRSTAPSPAFRTLVPGDARGPQGDLPRHQGPPQHAPAADRACSTSGWRRSRPTTSTCFFIHGLGDEPRPTTSLDWPKSKEFKETVEAIRKSGKAKFVGFSSHHARARRVPPGGGRGRDRRRDHAPVHPLARQGRPAEQGARRLPQEGDRPDLDEAGRRPDATGDPRRGPQAGPRASRRRG